MVNVGIIGLGSVAQTRHIPGLAAAKNAAIYGFFDMDQERAGQYAARYGCKAWASLEEMLADEGLHAVEVCTATRSHCELTVAALEAGKHVLCEKPMAASAADARRMIAAAEKSGKKLMVSHNQRYYDPHRKAKELLEAGVIGRLISFRTFLGNQGPEYVSVLGANNAYFSKAASGRGTCSDLGSHRLDLMRFITGGEYKRVMAYTPTLVKKFSDGSPIDVDDHTFAILEMENGVVGTFTAGWGSMSGNDRSTVLLGTGGMMKLYDDECPLKVELADGTVERINFKTDYPVEVVQVTTIDQSFVDCIENDTPPPITGRDGLAVILAIDAIEAANQSGTWADVAPAGC